MRVTVTALPEVLCIEIDVYSDARGDFFELWSATRYAEHGVDASFLQDNVSRSARDVLRGLHLQAPPHDQGKLVSVLDGEVFDVAVDVRVGSPRFGRWVGVSLSAANRRQLWIPRGFAHGFCVTGDTALVSYKCTQAYDAGAELAVAWNDPDLAIGWPVARPLLSPRDAAAPVLREVPAGRLPRMEHT